MTDLKLFKTINLNEVNDNECVKKNNFIGFAHCYFWRCNSENVTSKSDIEITKEVYTKLVELDSRLGTAPSEQLFVCILYTLDLDIIKV